MKKFLCYDTNDAASGKINVSANGVLKPNSTVPATNGAANQQLVTDGDGNVKWEDRLAYEGNRLVVDMNSNSRWVRVFDEVPAFVFDDVEFIKIWRSNGEIIPQTMLTHFSDEILVTEDGVVITLSDNAVITGTTVTFPKKGVYFASNNGVYVTGIAGVDGVAPDTPEITWDGNIETIKTIDPKYIPSELNEVILPSSTSGSSKKFKITVDDSGAITATEV